MAELTPERFAAILAAYGADPRRWPEGERAAALAHLRASPDAARSFDAAADLDERLLLGRVPAPSEALRRRVLAGAPRRRPWRGARLWWAGIALAGAGAAGAVTGSAAAAALEPALHRSAYAHEDATAFGAITNDPEE